MYFFFQLSRVVDLNVYLNIDRELKMLLYVFLIDFYFYERLMGCVLKLVPFWAVDEQTCFLSFGKSVQRSQLLEVTINRF
jgi:hypothetical protein